jgi:hypothetical protein
LTDAEPLAGLHEIVLAEPVSLLPQTIGWWILLAMGIGALAWLGVVQTRRHRRDRYRRAALAELDALQGRYRNGGGGEILVALPALLKRTALAAYPRSEVAALVGDAWLDFLDRTGGGGGFVDGPGRRLPELAYVDAVAPPDEEIGGLFDLVRRWIREHRREALDGAAGE